MRLNQLARKLDISTTTIINFLQKQGVDIKNSPNTKLSQAHFALLEIGWPAVKNLKTAKKPAKPTPAPLLPLPTVPSEADREAVPKGAILEPLVVPKVTLTTKGKVQFKQKIKEQEDDKKVPVSKKKLSTFPTPGIPKAEGVKVPTIIPTLTMDTSKGFVKVYQKSGTQPSKTVTLRKRILKSPQETTAGTSSTYKKNKFITKSTKRNFPYKKTSAGQGFFRKKKRGKGTNTNEIVKNNLIKVTEFVSTQELALLMNFPVEKVVAACKELDIEVSVHQRLDANTIELVAELLEKQVELVQIYEKEANKEEAKESTLQPRDPTVVVMGHVDHGKTSLLDYIRKAKVTEGEAGGITQHIGAYQVVTKGKKITFLDTPGHKAFTAMRARGAQVTDIAIIVIAADDIVMPQTKEAIRHAQLAEIPIVFALNKIDLPAANIDKIKGELGAFDIKLEEWGGNYQCQPISAKTGQGVDELLEKVLLEAEMLDLKAEIKGPAMGTVLETSLEKGRGYLTTVIVQKGTLCKGDIVVAGPYSGKIKIILSSQGKGLKHVLPSTPVQLLGFNGPPQAGQSFHVVASEKESRARSEKYQQVMKEQKMRARQGNVLQRFEESLTKEKKECITALIKGDVDGSVEVLADELLSLSTDKINVKVIYKAVGPICESDVLLAAAADALIIGFHTKLDSQGRKAQDKAKVEIKLFNIIYEAKDYLQAMIDKRKKPVEEETMLGEADVVKIFSIPNVGTVAGCIVKKGIIRRNAQIRIIQEGQVTYTGPIRQLKKEKEVINEARTGTECGISMQNFNAILVGDCIECFELKTLGT